MKVFVNNTTAKKIGVYLLSFLVVGYGIVSLIRTIRSLAPDFNVYYFATWDLLHGISPYGATNLFTGLGYPPVTTLFFIPLTFFPYFVAQGLWLILSALTIPLCIFLCLKILKTKITLPLFFLILSLTLLSFPTKFTLGMGQSNFVAYAILLGAFLFSQKDKRVLSGILLGIAVLLKPIFIILILYFLLQRQWKIVLICLVTGLVFLSFSLLVYNDVNDYIYYFFTFIPHLENPAGREVYYNQGSMGFVARIIPIISLRSLLNSCLSIATLLGIVFVIVKKRIGALQSFAIFLTLLVLVDSLSWQHHFVFLLFPFLFLGLIFYKEKNKRKLLLLGIAYALISVNIKNPGVFGHFPTILLLSHVFYGALLLLGLCFGSEFADNKSKRKKS